MLKRQTQAYVPSTGALRVLRRLAYAGSVASSLGALAAVEKQRRAISVATTARDNARKIKASRTYHEGGGLAVAELNSQHQHQQQIGGAYGHGMRVLEVTWEERPQLELGWGPLQPGQGQGQGRAKTKEKAETTLDSLARGRQKKQDLNEVDLVKTDLEKEDLKKRKTAEAPRKEESLNPVASRRTSVSYRPATLQGSKGTELKRLDRAGLSRKVESSKPGGLDRSSTLTTTLQDPKPAGISDLLPHAPKIGTVDTSLGHSKQLSLQQASSAQSQLRTQMIGYLEQNDWQKAQEVLQEAVEASGKPQIDAKTAEAAEKLALETVKVRHFDLTKKILWTLDSARKLDGSLWTRVMSQCIVTDHPRQAIQICEAFRESKLASSRLYASIFRATLEESRLAGAKEVVLPDLTQKQYQQSRLYPAQLLTSTWRSSKDLQKTEDLFVRLKGYFHDPSEPLPKALYNAMIQACVQAKRPAQAHKYLEEMREDGIEPDLACYGNILLASAYRKDWRAVHEGFRSIINDKHIKVDQDRLAAIFTPILIEHFDSQGLDMTLTFLRTVMEDYGVQPNRHSSNFIITRLVDADNIEAVMAWIQYVKGFGLRFDAESVKFVLKRHWFTFKSKSSHLRALCAQIGKIDAALIDEGVQSFLEYVTLHDVERGQVSEGRPLQNALGSLRQEPSHEPSIEQRQSEVLEHDMRTALARGDGARSVLIFRRAMDKAILLSDKAVAIAVKGVFQPGGSSAEATNIIRRAKQRGIDIQRAMASLFSQEMGRVVGDGGESRHIRLHRIYRLLERNEIPVSEHNITSAASALLNLSQPQAALDLLVSRDKQEPLSVIGMTVLLRSYSDLREFKGICWTARKVLKRNLHFDRRLLDQYEKARRHYASQSGEPNAGKQIAGVPRSEQDALRHYKRRLTARLNSYKDASQRREDGLVDRVAQMAGYKEQLAGAHGKGDLPSVHAIT